MFPITCGQLTCGATPSRSRRVGRMLAALLADLLDDGRVSDVLVATCVILLIYRVQCSWEWRRNELAEKVGLLGIRRTDILEVTRGGVDGHAQDASVHGP